KNGTVKKFVLWDPVDFGYLTVHAARRLADGELEDGTASFGRLGELEVKDGVVVLGAPLVFDIENIDRYQF
ncbi:MAG: rhamnose ABC transporter substrate-binding protein, partial [Planctomycetes bacterium]|nr:rhamnose ABC transporter substrate-binding protein [Planctomycetota bacterium]